MISPYITVNNAIQNNIINDNHTCPKNILNVHS